MDVGSEAEFARIFVQLGAVLFACAGVCLMVRAKRLFTQFVVLGVGSIAIGQIGAEALAGLPIYVLVGLGALIGLALLGRFLRLVLGRGASDIAIGNVAATLITFVLVPVLYPLRMLRRLIAPPGLDGLREGRAFSPRKGGAR